MLVELAPAQFRLAISECEEVDMSRVPILAILGLTGCGKSRLAIELACRFLGEIISADSMQVYKGLDIITAKVTKEEREMAPHHMLDIVDPLVLNFNVIQFKEMAQPIINDLRARGKLPIIVGGTNYYIESLLWKILIDNQEDSAVESSDSSSERSDRLDERKELFPPLKKMKTEIVRSSTESNEVLYQKLIEVDPEMAKCLHPNNRRKIIRSLEVFEQYGVTISKVLKVQRETGGSRLGGPLRYPDSIILWLRCDEKVLDARLESRVDAMLEAGLVQELLDFHRRYNKQRIETNTLPDYTKGIFQSIGFKEFHDYLILPEEEKQEKKGEQLLKRGIDDLKLVTKRYAKKQQRWIMNRLIRCKDRQMPPIYTLDCTNLDEWNSCVYEPAVEIIEAITRGEKPKQQTFSVPVAKLKVTDGRNDGHYHCNICERLFVGDFQWNAHLKSMKHAKVLRQKRRREEKLKEAEEKLKEAEEKLKEAEELAVEIVPKN